MCIRMGSVLAALVLVGLHSPALQAMQATEEATVLPIVIPCGLWKGFTVTKADVPLKSTGGSSVSLLESAGDAAMSLKLTTFRCSTCSPGCTLGRLTVLDGQGGSVNLSDSGSSVFDNTTTTFPDGSVSYNSILSIPEGYYLSSGCSTCLE